MPGAPANDRRPPAPATDRRPPAPAADHQPPAAADDPPASVAVTSARTKLLVALAAGIVGGTVAALTGAGRAAPLIGWDILALGFGSWTWLSVWRLDPAAAESHAKREDPGRDQADLILLGAAIASLIAVGLVLFGASGASGDGKYVEAGLAVASVFVSWALVHTVFTLKYARLYYTGTPGGIDFHDDAAPDYRDFAYLAFTVGMTFQVSDTDIKAKPIRRTILRHAWMSFPLVSVIIATTINLVSGLAK